MSAKASRPARGEPVRVTITAPDGTSRTMFLTDRVTPLRPFDDFLKEAMTPETWEWFSNRQPKRFPDEADGTAVD